ncbi:hypothetical protein [Kitasatospora sp. NPDC059571]|uniref:hypothetical protein n=1 Tax=Kitasatospora sp. NPDC059571 TaxID=3346871 RepID=UPI0036992DC0
MALAHVVLADGRSVELTSIQMHSTYGGLLEGYPFRRWNDRIVGRLRAALERAHPSGPVHLVDPVREETGETPGAFGPVELLPAVTCTGFFESHPVDGELDAVLHRSRLAVAWFQATPALPSGEDADPGLRAVRWSEWARDFEL